MKRAKGKLCRCRRNVNEGETAEKKKIGGRRVREGREHKEVDDNEKGK